MPDGTLRNRAYVGKPEEWDLVAARQVTLLLTAGLRDYHRLVDVGCGSLRAGRMLIPYLEPERYFGIEPNRWLVEEGIEHELGGDLVRIKRPLSDSWTTSPSASSGYISISLWPTASFPTLTPI